MHLRWLCSFFAPLSHGSLPSFLLCIVGDGLRAQYPNIRQRAEVFIVIKAFSHLVDQVVPTRLAAPLAEPGSGFTTT
jgi:hypothetical protein